MGYVKTMLEVVKRLGMARAEEDIRVLAITGLERRIGDIDPLPIAMDVDQ